MKAKVLFSLIILLADIFGVSAQQTAAPQVRTFDQEKLEKIRQNPAFNYEDDIAAYKEYDPDWEYKRWRWEEEQRKKMEEDPNWEIKRIKRQEGADIDLDFKFGKNAIYIASAIAIIFLLLALLGIDLRSIFRKNKTIAEDLAEEDWQHLDKSDIDKLLEQAIAKEQYNQAIRYAFLKSLHILGQKNYIQLQKEKTNAEYQVELNKNKKSLIEAFKWQSRVFAYIQYGEFEINKNQFEALYPKFKSFYQSI